MCPLLLKLLPLFTGSVFWVERLPLVISGDDLPMEWALYKKHRAADGQEISQIALGEGSTAKPPNHVPSPQGGDLGRDSIRSLRTGLFIQSNFSLFCYLWYARMYFPNLVCQSSHSSSCRRVVWLL